MSYNLLKGKKGIIFGALDENSIAWKTAERVFEEGGEFVLTNAPIALRMGNVDELAKKTNSKLIAADATKLDDLENLINQTTELFNGKIDLQLTQEQVQHFFEVIECIRKTTLNFEHFNKEIIQN